MVDQSSPLLISRFQSVSRAASGLTLLIGGLVLVGWATDVGALKTVLPGLVSMKANTALAFVLAGLSLWLLRDEATALQTRRIAHLLAGTVALIGLLTLTEYALGRNLGIDQLLFQEAGAAVGTSSPGRMAPNTALNFLLVGIALGILDLETRRGYRPAQFFVLAAIVISLLALIGYLYGEAALFGIASYTQMALHTAVAFLLLSFGILFTRPGRGLMQIVVSDTAAGFLLRRMLPAAMGVPILLGYVRLLGERAALYDTVFGLALMVISTTLIFVVLIYQGARSLYRTDAERIQAENARDRFFNLSLDMLCISGFDGYFKELNPSWERTLGWTQNELLSRHYSEFVHPDDRESTFNEGEKVYAGEHVISFENRYICKDGSYKWLLWTAVPLPEEQLIYAAARDITDRKRMEAALRESEALRASEERVRLIIDTAYDAFITIDADGLITNWNRQAEITFGWSRGEVVGKPLTETIMPAHYREAHQKGIQHFLATGEGPALNTRLELSAVHRDGRELPIELTISPLRVGHTWIFNAFLHDITERKQAEKTLEHSAAQLEAANKELESFSYSVSHDLRAPLRHIDGFIELLKSHAGTQLDAKSHRYMDTVMSSAKRMSRLIDDLLVFSRMAKSEMRMGTVDLDNLVQEVIHDLRTDIQDREVRWRVSTLPPVAGDPAMLRQVWANLMGNAVKYTRTRTPAEIEIGCAPQGNDYVFSIRDNGVGFDPQYAGKLFGVFQRLHGSDEFEGTGIGLANVRRIVTRHGGRTWAEGRVDGGAVFYFSLPTRGEQPG